MFTPELRVDADADLAGVHSALQASSTKHPGSDGIVVQLVAHVPADDLHRGLL